MDTINGPVLSMDLPTSQFEAVPDPDPQMDSEAVEGARRLHDDKPLSQEESVDLLVHLSVRLSEAERENSLLWDEIKKSEQREKQTLEKWQEATKHDQATIDELLESVRFHQERIEQQQDLIAQCQSDIEEQLQRRAEELEQKRADLANDSAKLSGHVRQTSTVFPQLEELRPRVAQLSQRSQDYFRQQLISEAHSLLDMAENDPTSMFPTDPLPPTGDLTDQPETADFHKSGRFSVSRLMPSRFRDMLRRGWNKMHSKRQEHRHNNKT